MKKFLQKGKGLRRSGEAIHRALWRFSEKVE